MNNRQWRRQIAGLITGLAIAIIIWGGFATPQALSTAQLPRTLRASSTTALLPNDVQYELIGRYDLDRLNTILTTELADFTATSVTYTPPRNAVNLYRVSYSSVIPERGNQLTTAYGLIAIPDTDARAMPMVSYQHGTVYGKQEVPSFPDNSTETRLMLAQFAGQGYIVIGADYFGMGLSTEKEGYLVKASHQQACLDMYYAALEILRREGIQVTDFFVAGWSQGGFVTMAFLEKLESLGIPVRAASTSSTPADAFAGFSGFLMFPRPLDAPWITTIFILSSFSFEEYYGIPGLAQALILPEKYDVSHRLYLREPLDVKDIPTDLHALIRPEYFDPHYLAESAYGRLLKQTQCYQWVIQTPVRSYYGEVDEAISLGMAHLPMRYQQSMGNEKVEALSAGATTHRGTFVYSIAEQKRWFDSLQTS